MYATVEWILEGLFSVVSLITITEPRKPLDEYKVEDMVKAKFRGTVYPARIVQLSGE